MTDETKEDPWRDSPRKVRYRLLKDGHRFEASMAVETGTEVHQAIETLLKYGLVFMPEDASPRNLTEDEIIAGLDFKPFKYELRSPGLETDETRKQVRSGAVLKLKDGFTYFVGDVNDILGVCDDCTEFSFSDIAEIAYLWGEKPEKEVAKIEEEVEYRSPRGFRLAYNRKPGNMAVVTCELCEKWYSLYVVSTTGEVVPLNFADLIGFSEANETAVGDHCVNPRVLERYADAWEWTIDDLSMDLIEGRWITCHG
jgi:hypothetical protein